jgi:TP901-1 family phage major tail protein
MAGPIVGRKVRIKYYATGFGAAGVEIARAQTDELSINNELIDASSKDPSAWVQLLDEVGVKSVEMSVSGILSDEHKALVGLAMAETDALVSLEMAVETLGTFRGLYGISSFKAGGNHGAETATFSASFNSAAEITWAAAV